MPAVAEPSRIEQSKWRILAPFAVCVTLALITIGIFAQTFSFKFLNFDDDIYISANPRLTQGLSDSARFSCEMAITRKLSSNTTKLCATTETPFLRGSAWPEF